MMERRRFLAFCGKTIVAGAGWLNLTHLPSALSQAVHDKGREWEAEALSSFDEHLQADMKRLATRVYSEEGIPMILACEDLTSPKHVALPATGMNAAVSSAFRRYVDAWQRIKPDAPATDVPKLVELLSDRDFVGGGGDKNL